MPVVIASTEKTTKKRSRKKKVIESFQKIDFLNTPEKSSMASIGVKINGDITTNGSRYGGDNYEIRITDCHNHITLHGSLKNPESRNNALRKFDTIIKVLTEGRNHIEQQLKQNRLKY